jgi:hypothetical protein
VSRSPHSAMRSPTSKRHATPLLSTMRTVSPPSPARHLRHATQDGCTRLVKGLATVNAERQQAGQAPSSHRKIGSTCCAKGPGRFGRCKGPRPGWVSQQSRAGPACTEPARGRCGAVSARTRVRVEIDPDLAEAHRKSPFRFGLVDFAQVVELRSSVRHTELSLCRGVRRGGHIDMRAHTKVLSALRTDTPA